MQAQGTTLGADNGIGVATALALLDMPADAKLPPLECLFTVDEETGLTGAFDLDANMLTGAELETRLLLCERVFAIRCCTVLHLAFTGHVRKMRAPHLVRAHRAGQVLLNLDTEDWGEIFIGCAGGGDSMISLPVTYEATPSSPMQPFELRISGRPTQLVTVLSNINVSSSVPVALQIPVLSGKVCSLP